MKSQLWKTILNLLVLVLILAGCSGQTVVENTPAKEKLVQVQTIKEDTLPLLLKYTGMTSAREMRKYSFKVPGKTLGNQCGKRQCGFLRSKAGLL